MMYLRRRRNFIKDRYIIVVKYKTKKSMRVKKGPNFVK